MQSFAITPLHLILVLLLTIIDCVWKFSHLCENSFSPKQHREALFTLHRKFWQTVNKTTLGKEGKIYFIRFSFHVKRWLAKMNFRWCFLNATNFSFIHFSSIPNARYARNNGIVTIVYYRKRRTMCFVA